MPHLAISLLGAFEAIQDGSPVTGFKTEKARALLAYLAVERDRAHRRQSLVGLLWPDYPEKYARTNLRQALTNLRQVLNEAESQVPILLVEGETIQFNPESDFWLDVMVIEKGAAASQSEVSIEDLQTAIAQYRGGFLEGFSLKDSPDFDHWTSVLRERYQGMVSTILGRLGDYYEKGQDFEKAANYAHRRLELEPWQEQAHRQLMHLLVLKGRRPEALVQYEACRKALKDELGVEPSAETRRLYESIRDGEIAVPKQEQVRRHNLPVQVTSFIGREKEIAKIKELLVGSKGDSLSYPNTRLVTLTGAGGTGKTRLALQTARDVLEQYPDGVWLVELASIADPGLVVEAAAQALGMQLASNPKALSFLQDYLESRHLLLILDNCEHLVEACARLADTLLHACPTLSILATSREALGIEGETSYLVPQLTLPGAGETPPLEALTQYEAVRLFVERAGNASIGFRLTSENALAVVQVCQRLDGIALALELAAARVKMLRVEEIARHLDDRFHLLTGGSRAALPRYQTLRASIDWSYDLLSPAEQRLLQGLSVFAGGWTFEAAEFVGCGEAIQSCEVMDLLGELLNKSMVSIEVGSGPMTRYRMLETIRQYAYEKLVGFEGAESGRDRHLQYFVKLAEKLEEKMRGPEHAILLNCLEAELDNLRLALDWSLESKNPEVGLRLASALLWYWTSRSRHVEAVQWIERLLACEEEERKNKPASQASILARAKALRVAGFVIFSLRDSTKRIKLSEESRDLSRQAGAAGKRDLAYAVFNLSIVAITKGELSQAISFLEESRNLFEEVGDQLGLSESLNYLGWVAISSHEYEQARIIFEENLALRKKIGDQEGIAWVLYELGWVFLNQHEFIKARPFMEESLIISSEIKSSYIINAALSGIGLIDWLQGKYEQATRDFKELLSNSHRQGDLPHIQIGFSYLSKLALSQDDYKGARELMEESLAIARKKNHQGSIVSSLCDLGSLALAKEEIGQAAQKFSDALSLSQEIGLTVEEVYAIYGLGKVAYHQGDFLSARRCFIEAIEKWPGLDYYILVSGLALEAQALEALAFLAASQEQMKRAARLLGATEDYHQKFKNTRTSRERAERASAKSTVQEVLGETAFTEAWEEGKAMTQVQAIAYAKEEGGG